MSSISCSQHGERRLRMLAPAAGSSILLPWTSQPRTWGIFGSREVQNMGITGAWLGCGGWASPSTRSVWWVLCSARAAGAQNRILGDGPSQLLLLGEKHKSLSCNMPRVCSMGMGMAGIVNTPGGRRERSCTSPTWAKWHEQGYYFRKFISFVSMVTRSLSG